MTETAFDQNPTKDKDIVKRLENNGKKDLSYKVIQKTLKIAIEGLWGDKFKVSGLENIPTSGSALIAPNHPSHADWMFLVAAIDRPMHFVGWNDEEFNPKTAKITDALLSVINVGKYMGTERGRLFSKQYKEIIGRGEMICIFPEKLPMEDRKDKNTIGEFATGVIHIAKKHNLPIIPVYISGTQNVRPDSKPNPFQRMYVKPVEIIIGKPISPNEISRGKPEQLREVIVALKNQTR